MSNDNDKKKAITKAPFDCAQDRRRYENTKGEGFIEQYTFFVLSSFRVFVVTSLAFTLYSVCCLLYSKYIELTTPYLFVGLTSTQKSPNALIWQEGL